MMFSEKVGDVVVRFSAEQVSVLAVEVEIFLRPERVALEYFHRALDEILDERLFGANGTQHQSLIFHQRKQQTLNLQTPRALK